MRTNYDEIAHLYDAQSVRQKDADLNLAAYLRQNPDKRVSLAVLDMGCGTGWQQAANGTLLPDARLVGLDLFLGMLRQAQLKNSDLFWVQADNSQPPFPDNSFDYISNQFSFHHVGG